MEFEYGPLVLKSHDRLRMVDLLTDVFEFDVDTQSDLLTLGPWRLKIIETSSTDPSEQSLVFEFNVFSQEDLNEISSKFHFFLYRKNDLSSPSEKIISSQTDLFKTISVVDLDGREWQFKLKIKV